MIGLIERRDLVLNPMAQQVARRIEVLLTNRMFGRAQQVLAEWCREQEHIGDTDDSQHLASLVSAGLMRARLSEELMHWGCQTIGDLRARLGELVGRTHRAGLAEKSVEEAGRVIARIDRRRGVVAAKSKGSRP